MQNAETLNEIVERTPVRLGRYEIMCKLGAGGMADVFLAHQPGPFSASKLVVIKQLRSGIVEDEQFVQMFANESRIAVRLNHPNVVHTYEVVAEDGQFYLILEFLDGKSLHQVLHRAGRDKVPLSMHVWLLTQVLAGLQYAHELKDFDGTPLSIVHRDVSPANVFVTYAGEIKLLDFGIAKSVSASHSTREGIIKGKLGYASPEQCLCKATDSRTDLFSVGVMLWEAIAGRKRSMGETDASIYQARVQGSEARIEQVCPKTPRELISICNQSLALRPEQRYQTAQEFRQALERYLQSVDWHDGPEQMREFMQEQFRQDIAEMRQRIDAYMTSSRPLGTDIRGQSATLPVSASSRAEGTGLKTATALTHIAPMIAAWYRRPLPMGAVIIGGLCLGGLGLLLRGSSQPPVTSGPATVVHPATPAEPSPAPANKDHVAAQSSDRVSVTLAAIPSSAVIELDGRRISNPYRAVHGQDNAPHHVSVTLSGYERVERELQFARDVDVTIVLSKSALPTAPLPVRRVSGSAAQSAAASVGAASNSRSQPAAAPALARPAPVVPPAAPLVAPKPTMPAATQGPVQPGEDLRSTPARAKVREIEETDPYKR